jgi:hypothetical protein
MFALKPISEESVPSALAKAERYRLLNEPQEAESICRDILAIEPDNQHALISLILALTDQLAFDAHAFANTISVVERLQTPYDRAYYAGIAWERRAKARHYGGHGAQPYVYEWIMKAMELFEQAEGLRPAGNDDALLRWNACVRYLGRHKELAKPIVEVVEPIVSE